jgi:hypothetical protein
MNEVCLCINSQLHLHHIYVTVDMEEIYLVSVGEPYQMMDSVLVNAELQYHKIFYYLIATTMTFSRKSLQHQSGRRSVIFKYLTVFFL